MESTKGKIEFLLTVVGATGLPPSDENHPTNFYVAVEVDGKHGRTAELAPSPQSTIEWNVSFPLIAVKASYIALRVYECWEAMLPDHPRGDEVIWESRATAQQLMGCGSKFTNLTLPAKAPHEEGYLIVKVERGAHAEAERPVVDEAVRTDGDAIS
ncbi:hypothetical protein BV22DRAFT_1049316 [Leucogyrophana mollusca]|uniref:Uncharacterized protein n=1 Tax=Leucogyrophana mollusca TaxID=85980 RepID=A0ACB8B8W0_9AGAM|nr:hypothetical protein BV22DRAFT_1049316 [Leucogyrophana mollusca]